MKHTHTHSSLAPAWGQCVACVCLLTVCHLYLLLVQEDAVLDEACRLLPAALQLVQVEVIERAVRQPGPDPRAPVVS